MPKYSALFTGLLLVLPLQAMAAPATSVSDSELAGLRGRYVDNGRVLALGVDLATDWQTRDGRNLHADVQFSVTHGTPHLSFTAQVTKGSGQVAPAANGAVTINAGGITNVSGVAQSIQLGGDGNTARNDLTINLMNGQGAVPVAPADNGNRNVQGDGMDARLAAGGKDLSLDVKVDGQGEAQQSLGDMGFLQTVAVTGDGNIVHNNLMLDAVMARTPAFSAAALAPALTGMISRGGV